MQIFVKHRTGTKTLSLNCSTLISELHDELEMDSLFYNGRPLRGGFTLEEYGIMNNATLESIG